LIVPTRRPSKENRILLVDDEQDILDILSRTLEMAGYHIDLASNGKRALEMVAARKYDLIITNIRMPIMNGEAFYRILSNSFPHMARKVIFCTGDIAYLTTQASPSNTGVPVILKPFQLRDVLETVACQLSPEHGRVPALPLVPNLDSFPLSSATQP
jgi:DNA-binding NtrC family response regulator